MADKSIIYTNEGIRSYDHMKGWSDSVVAIGRAVQAVLGSAGPLSVGFTPSAQTTPNMSINLTEGQVYSMGPVDNSNYGVLAADTRQILQQGYSPAQQLNFSTSGLTAGQSQCFLVQVAFEQEDIIRSDDPTQGVLPFVNTADLLDPLQGETGNLGTLPTCRQGFANVKVLPGTPANSPANPAPPAASAGAVALCVVTLTFGQTSITAGNITAAPNPASLAGLLQSHHGGFGGQAPKIDLTSEVQHILPLGNLPASNTNGSLSTFRGILSASPVGVLAGNIDDTCYCSTNSTWYVCTATGSPGTWGAVGGTAAPSFYEVDNAFPHTPTSSYCEIMANVSAAAGDIDLPQASTVPNASISVYKKDDSPNPVNVKIYQGGATTDTISQGLNSGLTVLPIAIKGNWFTFRNLLDPVSNLWIWYVK